MVFLVELTHRGTGGWNDIVDKEKQGILSSKMNSLPDQEVELTNCEIRRHQVFLFVQISYSSFGSLFYYHRDPVRVFLSDLLALRAALLERMLLFIYELHPPGNQVGPGWAEGTRGGGGAGTWGSGDGSDARADSAERSQDLRHFRIHQPRPRPSRAAPPATLLH